MTFFSILCALLIEQLKPLRADNQIYAEIKRLAMRIEAWFNAGHASHGRHRTVSHPAKQIPCDARLTSTRSPEFSSIVWRSPLNAS